MYSFVYKYLYKNAPQYHNLNEELYPLKFYYTKMP